MKPLEEAAERRVWQRVQGQGVISSPGKDLHSLILAEARSAAVYRHLLSLGKHKRLLQELLSHGEENIACLKGILALQHIGGGNPAPFPAPKGVPSQLLEGCFHRCRSLLAEYTARSVQPDYGAVFDVLAKHQPEQMVRIAVLLASTT